MIEAAALERGAQRSSRRRLNDDFPLRQESIRRAPRRKALIIAAIAMGSAVATAMLGVMLDIGDKINRELRSEGANIVVTAQAASLTGGVGSIAAGAAGAANLHPGIRSAENQEDLLGPEYHRILALARRAGWRVAGGRRLVLASLSQRLTAKRRSPASSAVNPAWQIVGPLAGGRARRMHRGRRRGPAQRLEGRATTITVLGAPFRIAGILSTGDEADDRVFLPLARVQELTGRPGQVDRIDVAALTKPEDDFARKDPEHDDREGDTSAGVAPTTSRRSRTKSSRRCPAPRRGRCAAWPIPKAKSSTSVERPDGAHHSGRPALRRPDRLEPHRGHHDGAARRDRHHAGHRRGARRLVATLFGLEIALVGLVGGMIGAFAGVLLAHYVGASVFHDAVAGLLDAAVPDRARPPWPIALAGAAQPLRAQLCAWNPRSSCAKGV